jgi:hypothetical protein
VPLFVPEQGVSPPTTGVHVPFQGHFDLDLPAALREQLVRAFDALEPASLADLPPDGNLEVTSEMGVYGLVYGGPLVYVGKADNLASRLEDHAFKIGGRQGISPADVGFKCLSVNRNWASYAPENILLVHYRDDLGQCEWNGIGFGPHDPGRNREETNKPPDGFDQRYPIRYDLPCPWVTAGEYPVLELLLTMKKELPFLLRFQADNSKQWKRGHQGYVGRTVVIPADAMPAHEIMRLIAEALRGWQATRFPSHMILYEEDREYTHGVVMGRGV